jgi:signal transduction histidine kinase/DNA-binding response OmpR family regulator
VISIPNLFSRVDRFFDKKQGNKDLNPEEEAEIRYMFLQGIVAPILTIVLGIVAWAISAKLVLEFSVVYFFSFFIASQIFKKLFRDFATTVLAFKTLMILLVSIYIMRMGGVLTSGGLFLLAVQAVTSSIISQKSWHNIFIISIFIVCMSLLIAFQSYFPTENALTPKQNLIIFAMSILSMTIYIFFFSLYAINILTKMEQRETQRQKELNDAKTRLYTNITHEFRTPLTVIHGLADSVKNNEQNNLSGKMETIIKSGKNLLQLVDQMLDLNKMESGQMLVNKISANIIPFLKYIFQLQEFYAEEKNISMVFNSKSQSFELEFDPEKTAAIVSNLLSNAIKFTPEGGQISMKVYHADENICIEIKDNGIGIPQEKLETIFDRFYQVDGTNTRKEGGAGIGLAITREFVNLLNGSIEVKSSTSLGTIFTVKLPYIRGNKKSTAIEALEEETESWEDSSDPHELFHTTSNGHHRLLIIEDNPDVIGYLKACYQNHFSIHVAKDGKEGYKLAIEEIPDIIISDIMMPEMDGFELCKKLKDDYRTSHIPIILLTAKADIPSRIEGLETGADAYIVKPFNQRELLVRMQKLLELRRKLFQRYSNGNRLEFSTDPLIQKEDQFFKKLNEIIQNNLGDELFNIQELCSEMGMSKSQLYRKFSALTTLSAAKYIRTLRMKRAKELLLNTSMNITEIGYEVGMKSVSVFSKVFKEEFGYSPTDFAHQKLTGSEIK